MLSHDVRFTEQKIQRRLALIQPLIYRKSAPIPPFRLQALDNPLVPPPLDADTRTWEEIPPNSYWGIKHLNFALASTFSVPADFTREAPAALHLSLGVSGDFDHPEALIYIDGEAYAAVDRNHQEIRLPARWRDGAEHRLLLHGWCGLLGGTEVPVGRKLYMGAPRVVQVDLPTQEFHAAARNALEATRWMDKNNPARDRLLNALDAAFAILDTREPFGDAFYASVPAALARLREGIAAAGQPLDVFIAAAGHAHIDTAWLWTVDQTRRKAERTFSNVLRLMDEFPHFGFVQSQPQLYDWIKADQPALFDGIKARIAEGRWEPIGGMWVEADCNLTGAESLVRQFMLGRRFFREHFGENAESPVLWLPDVFGYAWNLPQLIKQAGLDYFFTIKIGWNQYNKLPYDSFWWQGLDGTRVLTHFSTSPEHHSIIAPATYNAELDAMIAIGTWNKFQQKHVHNEILMSYGWGDGGGGPTREMITNLAELGAMPGVPQTRTSKVVDFFRRMEAQAGDKLPVWNAELYLEIHRGTYTTQARNKRWNRKSEFLLHDAEFLATVASMLSDEYRYPHDTLRQAWELVCLHQFHDIIPGSSINEVYTDSARYYARIRALGEQVRDEAIDVIRREMGGDLLLINPSGAYSNDLIRWDQPLPDGAGVEGVGHATVFAQAEGQTTLLGYSGGVGRYTIEPLTLPRTEAAVEESSFPADWVEVSPSVLDNGTVRVELNPAGDITRIFYYPLSREILPPGAVANEFQLFEDRPNNWDAWDIDVFFEDKRYHAEPAHRIEVVELGGLRATLEIHRRILNSEIIQRISINSSGAAIDFDTTVEWREKHILLKTAFPVDLLATKATHEIQWGSVERPTTRNHSWDWARFETCAHKWVMLEEGDFGVSLINDCKYGHDVKDNVIRLSLLRATTAPDAHADQGTHQFAYRLLIDVDVHDTIQSAYAFNNPAFVVKGSGENRIPRAITLIESMYSERDQAQIHVETIKRAEDDNGIIVRFYEYGRTRGDVTLEFGFPLREAYRTDILEQSSAPLQVIGENAVRLHVTPFQIVTLRLVPEQG